MQWIFFLSKNENSWYIILVFVFEFIYLYYFCSRTGRRQATYPSQLVYSDCVILKNNSAFDTFFLESNLTTIEHFSTFFKHNFSEIRNRINWKKWIQSLLYSWPSFWVLLFAMQNLMQIRCRMIWYLKQTNLKIMQVFFSQNFLRSLVPSNTAVWILKM